MSEDVDGRLLAALDVLDQACDARSIRLDVDAVSVRSPDGGLIAPGVEQGTEGMRLRFAPVAGTGTPTEVDVVYAEGAYELLHALALRVRAARSWDPRGWTVAAISDVLGTDDGPPADRLGLAPRVPDPARTYLACERCGDAYPLDTTPRGESCNVCGGALLIQEDPHADHP